MDPSSIGNALPSQTVRTGEAAPIQPAGRRDPVSKPGPADSAELSALAGRISQSLEADADRRAERVSQLAASVQSGSYQVDAEAVSRALVEESIAPGPNDV